MAQFDVYRIVERGLVIDCQSDWLADLRSRIVVPLRPPENVPAISARLNPLFTIDGEELVMATHFLRAVDARHLADRVTSLREHEYVIKIALDMIISGF